MKIIKILCQSLTTAYYCLAQTMLCGNSFISENHCKCLHRPRTTFPSVNGEGHSEGCVDQLLAGGEIWTGAVQTDDQNHLWGQLTFTHSLHWFFLKHNKHITHQYTDLPAHIFSVKACWHYKYINTDTCSNLYCHCNFRWWRPELKIWWFPAIRSSSSSALVRSETRTCAWGVDAFGMRHTIISPHILSKTARCSPPLLFMVFILNECVRISAEF